MSFFALDNAAFAAFARCSTVLLGKMLAMSLITAANRFRKGSFRTPEDVKPMVNGDNEKAKRMLVRDEDVERVRSAHRNDMENILPFFATSLIYLATGPNPDTAAMLFQVFTGARVVHTIVYLAKVPQPARVLSFSVGFGVTIYMLGKVAQSVFL